jgi:hypothetical protein
LAAKVHSTLGELARFDSTFRGQFLAFSGIGAQLGQKKGRAINLSENLNV